MNAETLAATLLVEDSPTARQHLLLQQSAALDDCLAARLKSEADRLLRIDTAQSLVVADLLCELAETSRSPFHKALGLLARANAYNIGLARYEDSLRLYEEAAALYHAHQRPVEAANTQIGRLYALANLGRYGEAESVGERAAAVLRAHGAWLPLAKLLVNLAITYGRRGNDLAAIQLFDEAVSLYGKLDLLGSPYEARVQFSRAIVLRNLGRFDESIQASHRAIELSDQTDQRVDQARSKQSLAITYFVLGRYNEALELLYQVRDRFVEDQRDRDVILVDLFISDCLLHLRRFHDVLERTAEVQTRFDALGSQLEIAQALLNQAQAYAGLQQGAQGQESLLKARTIFAAEGNLAGVHSVDLQRAGLLVQDDQPQAGYALALACAEALQASNLPIKAAEAQLVAARAALALQDIPSAGRLVQAVAAAAEGFDLPQLGYQANHLQGRLAVSSGAAEDAVQAYSQAIESLERLCGRLMIEHRADYLEDKDTIYGDMVLLCLDLNRPAQGLQYAERAKSRALLDLLAYRMDLSICARSPQDSAIVAELSQLRAERDRLCRRRESREEVALRNLPSLLPADQVMGLEKRITDLWHELLVRNADYARDAALWQVRSETVQPLLPADTLLVEYFIAKEKLVLFAATRDDIEAHVLAVDPAHVQELASKLWLNLRSTPFSRSEMMAALTRNAQQLLHQLYQALLEPIQQQLTAHHKIIVVPHASLHYLPFPALYDGERYLLERHEFSTLPGSSFLRYCQASSSGQGAPASFGYSLNGHLPSAAREAQTVARLVDGAAWVEEDATLEQLRQVASDARLLHMATHGEFRPDNPLFSGLFLADGTLTTLDVFNLRLHASLVTLSACQTGQSVVSGGDELLGLMRAFLYAGASSLALTLWPVEDQATERLMTAFYTQLAQGRTKGAALRAAQLALLHPVEPERARWQHPYYWASFFLVGSSENL